MRSGNEERVVFATVSPCGHMPQFSSLLYQSITASLPAPHRWFTAARLSRNECWETSPPHVRICVCFNAYRGLLTLYARAVKPQSRDAVRVALDVKDALVISLSRLRLGQVLSQQGDRPHNSSRDVDLGGGQDLRALLEVRKKGFTKTIMSRECDRTF